MHSLSHKVRTFISNPVVGTTKVFNYYVFQLLPFRLVIKFFQVNKVLSEKGFFASVRAVKPVDGKGNPVPWFTYSASEYLRQFDLSDKTVFEFGAGNSSFFFAERAKMVTSVDDGEEWYKILKDKLNPNQKLIFASSDTEYINSLAATGQTYDIILVDGSNRFECIKQAVKFLREGGMIILDNSDWYPETSKYLREQNLIEVDFSDLGPQNGFAWCTSIFLHREFKFPPVSGKQPNVVTGGVKNTIY